MARIGRGIQQQGFNSSGPTLGPHEPTVVLLFPSQEQQTIAVTLSGGTRLGQTRRFPLQGWNGGTSDLTNYSVYGASQVLLDDFARADEIPIGGNWTNKISPAALNANLTNNQFAMSGTTQESCAWWNPTTFSNVEVSATFPVLIGVGAVFYARLANPGTASRNGYRIVFSSSTLLIQRLDSGVLTTLSSQTITLPKPGCMLGVRCIGPLLEVWMNGARIATAADSTYTTGFVGLGLSGSTIGDVSAGSFRAGEVSGVVSQQNGFPAKLLGPRPPRALIGVPFPPVVTSALVAASLTKAIIRRQQAQQREAKSLLFPPQTLAQPPPFFGPQVCLLPVDRMGRRQRRHNLTWFLSPPVVVDPGATFVAAPLTVRLGLAETRPRRMYFSLKPPIILQTFAGTTAHTVNTRPRRTIRTLEPPVLVRVPQVEQQEQTIRVVPARIRPRPTKARVFAPGVLSVFPGPQTHLVRTRPKATTSHLSPPTTLRAFAAATAYLARVRPRATQTLLSPPATLQEFFGPYEKQIAVTAAASPRRHSPISKLSPPTIVRVPSVEQREQTIVTAIARIRPRHTIAKLAAPSVLQTFPATTVHLVQARPRPTVQTLTTPTVVRVPAVEQQEQTVRVFTARTRPRATGAFLSPPTTLQTFEGPSVALARSRPRPTSAFVSAPTVLQTFAGPDVTTVRTRPRPTEAALAPPVALSTFAAAKATLARTRPQPTTTDLSAPTVINASVAVETTIHVTISGRTRAEQQRRASHWKLRQPVVVIPLPTLRMQTVQVALAHTRTRKTSNALSRPTVLQTFAGPTKHLVRSRPARTASRVAPPSVLATFSGPRFAFAHIRPKHTIAKLSPPTVVDRQISAQIQASLTHTRPRPTTHTLYPPTTLSTFSGASVHQARILPRPTTAFLRPPIRVIVPSVAQQEETIRVTLARTRPRLTRPTLRGPVDTPPVVTTLASSLTSARPERTLAGLRPLPVTVPQRVVEETIRVALVQPVGFRRVRSHLAAPTIVARLSQQAQTIRVQLARTRPRPTVTLVQPPIFPVPSLQQQTLRLALARIRPPRKRVLLSPPVVVAPQTFAQRILVKLAVQARLLLPRPRYRLSKPAVIIVPAPGVTFGEDVAASAVEDYDIASTTASDEETVAGTAVGSTDSAAVESTLSDEAGSAVEGEDKEAGT